MPEPLPDAVRRLLAAADAGEEVAAWEAFVAEYSRLLHLAARRSGTSYDDVMDRYAYILEGLRSDGCRRLRGFDPEKSGRFSTWIVVVASRLCVDFHRSRYGRLPEAKRDSPDALQRRRLVDLVGEELQLGLLPDRSAVPADERLVRGELLDSLAGCLEALEAEDRLLIRLRFEDGASMRETARVLGLSSEFAGYRRLKAVLKRLREALRDRGQEGGLE